MKKITVCIPVLNEQDNIQSTYEAVINVFKNKLKNYELEIIFSDNHSNDNTEKIILDLCKKDSNLKFIRFKNNLGYDKSVLECYKNSTGDATIIMDCDLQDPPEIFEKFINLWENGHDVVYGIRDKRNEKFTFLRKLFYKMMYIGSNIKYPVDAGDFRLVDKNVIKNFKDNTNLFPYMRGLTFSLAKNPKGIEYTRSERNKGKSKFNIYLLFSYAVNALVEETFFFIRLCARISLGFFILSSIFSVINLLTKFYIITFKENLFLLILTFITVLLSLIGEYVVRIYFQLKKTESIIYEKKINF